MLLDALRELRAFGAPARTVGLPDATIVRFAERHPALVRAVEEAVQRHRELRAEYADLLAQDEPTQIHAIQRDLVNFYPEGSINPYVALAARGPWIVTSKGAVLHDSGGYGMLGLGHGPDVVLAALSRAQVMANVMTANFSQLRLVQALQREIGHRRTAGSPFARFVCLNSGSEAMTLAARIVDIHAKLVTDPGGRHEGKLIKQCALRRAFHGRTGRPGQFSDSTRKYYTAYLATYRDRDELLTVEANDSKGLREMFARAEREGWYIEAMCVEPVMGEGNPGVAITREFYDTARELTRQHDSLFLVDSIQAGLRAHGCLSIVDYPGFEDADGPDLEAYSKALNAGQYPLSVLAMTQSTADLYRTGVYGNTMTTNPRGMDVACAVLEAMTPELRANIRERGAELLAKLQALAAELGGTITRVQGTGLLASCELDARYRCHGADSIEESMRLHGIGVIHGGTNSLRFTPHFAITSDEIDLLIAGTRDALLRAAAAAAPSPAAASTPPRP